MFTIYFLCDKIYLERTYYTPIYKKSKVFMNNCAIVCEYNPFHTGHKYQLDAARERADNIVCIMSGQFVQSALPAFCDKSIRTESALLGGVDAVIELPALYATASAQYFAEGAVKIASAIKNIKYVAMGATVAESDILNLADIRTKRQTEFSETLKSLLKSGLSYSAATIAAYSKLSDGKTDVEHTLSDPNNILCLEYIAAMRAFAPNVEPLIIKRRGAGYNDVSLDNEYVSASAIRSAFDDERAAHFIPYSYDKIKEWRACHAPDISVYEKIAVYRVKTSSTEKLSELRDCSEGLEFLLRDLSKNSDFQAYLDGSTCRRYGKKRIMRLMLDAILDIKKSDLNKKFYTRLLGCAKNFDFDLLPEFVKTNNADIKKYAESNDVRDVLSIDMRAAALYSTICSINGDYYNYSLVKV